MMRTRGTRGENIACEFLLKQGLKMRVRNYRTAFGEIDLIMQENNVIVFVEVKYRKSLKFGNPLESVGWHKQQKIRSIARIYLAQLGYEPLCRFDVIGILDKRIYWVKGAFT